MNELAQEGRETARTGVVFGLATIILGVLCIFAPGFTGLGVTVLVAILLIAAGIGIFRGAEWARLVGALVAMIGGVVAFAWLPWFPLWAVVYIAMSVAVVWALTVHGPDIAGG